MLIAFGPPPPRPGQPPRGQPSAALVRLRDMAIALTMVSPRNVSNGDHIGATNARNGQDASLPSALSHQGLLITHSGKPSFRSGPALSIYRRAPSRSNYRTPASGHCLITSIIFRKDRGIARSDSR